MNQNRDRQTLGSNGIERKQTDRQTDKYRDIKYKR